MIEDQARSLARWLQDALGNEYFVACISLKGKGEFKVVIYRLETDRPSVVIYNAISLTDGLEKIVTE